ncbi:MAG: 50S ribosomal protein L23 [Gammaproteobacteria bacterium]|nr:50S ribosomal protein L23 [Gammaproteobacteria bacterium]
MNILLAPHVSEKSTRIADADRQVVFKVVRDATKPEIKGAIELMFNVQVADVRVCNVKGKTKRFGRMEGRRSNWKKAYVTLKPGHDINFMGPQ